MSKRSTNLVGLVTVVGMLAATTGALPGAAFAQQDQPVTLTYASFGGALQDAEEKAWIEPYMQLHPNVKILYDNVDYAKLKAMVESGNVTWDVVTTGPDFGLGDSTRYLEKLDCTIISCADLQPDKFPQGDGYRVAQTTSGTVLGWNTQAMPAGQVPQSWADLFDLQRFPGKREVMGDMESMPLEIALVADGVPPDQLYPLDVQRALNKWDTIKDDVEFTTNYQGCAEKIATGDAAMGECWSGRFQTFKDNGQPVDYTWTGQTMTGGYNMVPKGSKNKVEAEKFIAYITSPEAGARFTDYISYGPANINADQFIKPDRKPLLGISNVDSSTIFVNDQFWADNRDQVDKTWQAWLTS
ncbi:MAG: extracellular solute-binding protein [Chloroflexi bacterium]|nr:extracellular solute-binding protein [Chloroflexota bacterium]